MKKRANIMLYFFLTIFIIKKTKIVGINIIKPKTNNIEIKEDSALIFSPTLFLH